MKKYPVKTTQLGMFLRSYDSDKYMIDHCMALVKKNYEKTKAAVERRGEKVFCYMGEPEFIVKPDRTSNMDPLCRGSTVAWKAEIVGRAFYIDRLRPNKEIVRRPYKKVIPKRLRGTILRYEQF